MTPSLVLALSVATQSAPAAPRSAADSAVDSARVIVRALVNARHIPGLAITVSRGDVITWSEGFGQADLAAARPATPETRFRIGSVSKTLTAVLLMRMAEERHVDLDAPIGTYLPLPPALAPITLRQLGGHLGGVRHYRGNEFFTLTHYATLHAALDVFVNDSLVAPPGTRYVYSSYGFNLIGAVLEAATARPYPDLLREYVLAPLGMRATGPDSGAALPDRAQTYDVSNGVVTEARADDLSGRWPSGGLLSPTADLARLGRAVLRPGLLTAASLQTMLTPQQLASGQPTTVGIGWRIGADSAGRAYWHHGGSSNGGAAFLLVYPAQRLVIAIASNAFTGWSHQEALAVAQPFLRAHP